MISREELSRATPNVETATIRYVRGDISRSEYEKQVEHERERDQRPPRGGQQSGSQATDRA